MKYIISEQEYQSLRGEMIERIKLMNTQAVSAITIVLTMWAAGVGILGIQLTNLSKLDTIHNTALCCSEIGAFFCALLILIPLSVKSGENLRQQVVIGCYLKIFYYYLVRRDNTDSDKIYPWEYINGLTNDIFKKKNKKSMRLQIFANSEYPILGLLSAFFSFSILITNYNIIFEKEHMAFFKGLFIFVIVIIMVVEILIILIVYKNTSMKNNMTNIADKTLKNTLTIAIKTKFIDCNEFDTAYEELRGKY